MLVFDMIEVHMVFTYSKMGQVIVLYLLGEALALSSLVFNFKTKSKKKILASMLPHSLLKVKAK